MKIEITINNGRQVKVVGLLVGNTYSGIFAANSFQEANEVVFSHIKCPKDWGLQKTLIQFPEKHEMNLAFRSTVYVLMYSTPIDPSYDESSLVYIWFDNLDWTKSIKEIIEKKIKSINWEDNAEDYNW